MPTSKHRRKGKTRYRLIAIDDTRMRGDRLVDNSYLAGLTFGEAWRAGGPRKLADSVKARVEAFQAKFGRDPTEDDPMMFNEDLDTPVAVSAEELRETMCKAILDAGLPGHLAHIYRKTGLIITESNRHRISPAQDRAAQAAYEEYQEIYGTAGGEDET